MKITNRWIVMFLMIPHLNIYILKEEPFKILTLAWQFVIVLIALIILLKKSKTVINKFMLLIILNLSIIIVSSTINNVLTLGIIYTVLVFIGFCIYFLYAIKDFRELIIGLYYIFVMIVLINFITIFIPNNSFSEPIYFLGGKNQLALTICTIVPIVYIYSLYVYNRLKFFPSIIIWIGILSIFLAGSGTGIVASILLIIFLLTYKKMVLSFKKYIILYVLIFLSIVIFRLQEILFGSFITNVLHKDLTFTGRTYIWDLVIESFKQAYILGLGRGNSIIIKGLPYMGVNEAHDGFLQIALDSGVLGILSFLLLIIYVGEKINLNKDHILGKVLSFSIFVYLIIGLTESAFYRKEFWILLILSYGLPQFITHFKDSRKV